MRSGYKGVVVFKLPSKSACSEGPIHFVARIGSILVAWTGLVRPLRDPGDCVDYIKRAIGLPGDEIQMIEGVLHVNGQKVGMEEAPNFSEPKGTDGEAQLLSECTNEPVPQGGNCEREQWIEELPGGRKHAILNLGNRSVDNTPVITVKPGHILFMGDNRDNSVDSRFPSVGQVPIENLIGRAEVIALSSEGAFWEVWDWRWSRFFKAID